ncbi:hypothetical protein [Vibrio barjaei]|uniref:hypothetical protein n=1 Tax=Vibrio barjaei TaxID=1676683 RepID=UPI0022841382|nr:hypothetical protein [Vibrio barjaei]MCY9870497.1 hypothetical protein [Vibrio barjaei]
MADNWSEMDQQILLDAMCEGINTAHVVEIVMDKTDHSEKEIRRRLISVGYLAADNR